MKKIKEQIQAASNQFLKTANDVGKDMKQTKVIPQQQIVPNVTEMNQNLRNLA